ncbi:Solute carrier family 40 member 1 [Platanthera guangdongensis]|uniref:Solute carrier family 40 member n=1 Tax=Platanthera guangdongensis TaxID=2320717 RepID=A0ABR2M8D9_9ASPA
MEEAGNVRRPLLGESSQKPLVDASLLKRMYVGHFLSRWGARMWEFSVGLYMINIWPESLLFTAIYGVVEAASTALFGPVVGTWVEKFPYKKVLRMWLLTRSLSFLAAGGAVTVLLVCFVPSSHSVLPFMALVILTNVSGAVSVLSTLAGTILIEREWVVVISYGHPPEVLTRMNSNIRRIDLVCKLFAPVLTGFIISFVSLVASAVILACWNLLSVWLEYWLWISVYDGIPALSETRQKKQVEGYSENILEAPVMKLGNISRGGAVEQEKPNWKSKVTTSLSKLLCLDAWIVYFSQDVVLPGVSLALLYFTVLSFGTLMTATLEWKGIPAYIIGIARGISAVIGIMATVVYPFVHSRISTLRTGLWSIWAQWFFLSACLASIWIRSSITSAWMLMGGVSASRLGLWMFDLAVMQLMQDRVSEADRCTVGGVQSSLQSMLDLLTYIMGIIVSDPRDFGVLVILSFVLVSSAAILYTLHCYRVRRHLFHFEKILAKIH